MNEAIFLLFAAFLNCSKSILNKIQEIEDEIRKTAEESDLIYDKSNPNYLSHVFPSNEE